MSNEIICQSLLTAFTALIPVLFCFMIVCFILFSVAYGVGISFLGHIGTLYRFLRKMKRVRRIRKIRGER